MLSVKSASELLLLCKGLAPISNKICLIYSFCFYSIVATVTELGKALGCYKITLNCKDDMIKFYSGLGYKAEEGNANFLMLRVPH